MKHIDFHTHKQEEGGNIQIRNVFAQDLIKLNPVYLFSTGIHPWHIEKVDPDDCFQAIALAAKLENMLAVGECGLDRSIATDFSLQEKYFWNHIEIAEKQAKPLIIHCVRAYSELIRIKKKTKSRVPWILHAYQGNLQVTKSLVDHGFYFSIGEAMLNAFSKHESLNSIPPERLFLETDDRENSIENIYFLAAEKLKMEEEQLVNLIFSNFNILFGTVKFKNY